MTDDEIKEINRIATKRFGSRFVKSTYGKKNQQGANAGKKFLTYEAVAPDGTVMRKCSTITDGVVFAGFYQHGGKWFISGIFRASEIDDPRNLILVRATVV